MAHARSLLNRLCFSALAPCLAVACSAAGTTLPQDGPTTAQEVLSRALARPLPETLQGMARVDSYQAGQARKADLLLALKRPASLQMQALAPTLDLLAVLSTDGKRFISFERGGSQCHVGDACPHNLARLVPIALPPEQWVQALLGRPPLLEDSSLRLHWDVERGLYRIEIGPASGVHQDVFVAPRTFRFVGTVLYRGAARVASLAYDGEVEAGGPPRTLRFKSQAQDLDVTLEMRKIELGKPIGDEVFAVTCPEGSQIVELPCEPADPKTP